MMGLLRVAKYIVVAAVVLAIGAELLGLVTSIVGMTRSGNVWPLLLMAMLTTGVFYQSGRVGRSNEDEEESMTRTIFDAIALVLGGMFCLALFLTTLHLGLVMLLGSMAGMCGVLALARDPNRVSALLKMPYSSSLSRDFASLDLHVLELPKGQQEPILRMLNERGLLPLSIWVLHDSDILLLPTTEVESLRLVLDEYGVRYSTVDSLFEAVVLALPLSDSVHPEDYVFLTPESRDRVLERWPVRMMLFPRTSGVAAIVPDNTVRGMPTESLSSSQAHRAVVYHELVTGDTDA